MVSVFLTIKGLVQGVGFRPFLFRLAQELQLKGWVKNTNEAVFVHLQGEHATINSFVEKVKTEHPSPARIDSITFENATPEENLTSFSILKSSSHSLEITSVSPDIAVCNDCLQDMQEHPFRINYPLVNCCHCGPRFSIVKELPYDRERTTMAEFKMCPNCEKEYNNPLDRRFHAQPVACNLCGPVYSLFYKKENQLIEISDIQEILSIIKTKILDGGIIAFKGTGGFHLVCDALNEHAVSRLRKLKHRDTKPFAIMFKDMSVLQEYTFLSEKEMKEISSFRRPILILEEKKALAPSVNLNLSTLGAMLPYMPFHYLIFNEIKLDALVMTSGNISDEPIIIDNEKAIECFIDLADAVLTYNRNIHNRLDDSVVRVINNKPRLIRRSRGYVPDPIILTLDAEGILAAGAELTGAFALGKNENVIMGQYCGDLQNVENFEFYRESLDRFFQLFRFKPEIVVHDQHPDYVSTRFAQTFNCQKIGVQHHHAHIASVIAEHQLTGKVLGVAFDGTGLGTDGKIWGSEFLLCQNENFERLAHFEYCPLPGGDKVITEPWRTAMAQLFHYFGTQFFEKEPHFLKQVDKQKKSLVLQALEKNIHLAWSCSAGRLFDAVAAATEICVHPKFHAEAPMRLEAAIDSSCKESYAFTIEDGIICFKKMWEELIKDKEQKISLNVIAAKFHNCIIHAVLETCLLIKNKYQVEIVALSGGSFQNKYLLENIEIQLKEKGFQVFSNEKVPTNDAGIALGQMYLAALEKIKNEKK